jgi:hypothetical protein
MMFDTCKEASMFDNLMKAAELYLSSTKTAEELQEDLNFETAYLKDTHKLMGKQSAAKCSSCGCVLDSPKKGCDCTHDKVKKEPLESEDTSSDEESDDPVIAEIKKKASDPEYTTIAKHASDPVLAQAMEKEAFGFGKIFGDLLQDPIKESLSSAFRKAPTKPNLTLDNMERKLLLQELMLTDPILSKHNAAKVARAFEQILRLSPELSKEKEVVRAELRAMMATQALSKFDADLMTKLDTGMLKRRVATMEFNKGEHQNFRL